MYASLPTENSVTGHGHDDFTMKYVEAGCPLLASVRQWNGTSLPSQASQGLARVKWPFGLP